MFSATLKEAMTYHAMDEQKKNDCQDDGKSKDEIQLFRSLRGQCFDYRDILQQVRRKAVPLLQVGRAVVGDPDLAVNIFPDQNL